MLNWDWYRRKAWVSKTSTLRSLISAVAATCDLQHMLCFIPKGKILLLKIQEQNAFLTGIFPLIHVSFLQWYTHNSGCRNTGSTNGNVNACTHLEDFSSFTSSRFFNSSSDYWTFWESRMGQFQQKPRGKLFSSVCKGWNQIQIRSL